MRYMKVVFEKRKYDVSFCDWMSIQYTKTLLFGKRQTRRLRVVFSKQDVGLYLLITLFWLFFGIAIYFGGQYCVATDTEPYTIVNVVWDISEGWYSSVILAFAIGAFVRIGEYKKKIHAQHNTYVSTMDDFESIADEFIGKEIARGIKPGRYADYMDYSIGFTTRGCFRKCSFCVNEKYDHVFRHSPVSEFMDKDRKYIYLWDDNILGYPQWREVFEELNATGKPFQFRQGMDMRLMTDEKAKVLTSSKYHGDFIFAFDHIAEREIIEQKLKIWQKYSTKVAKLYVLCGYESQDEVDIANTFERIKILMRYHCLPYIMRHENYNKSKYKGIYITLARWCNQPNFLKKKSFREFCEANQEYKKNQDTLCSSMKTMLEFEKDHPEIAAKYFDMKWDRFGE